MTQAGLGLMLAASASAQPGGGVLDSGCLMPDGTTCVTNTVGSAMEGGQVASAFAVGNSAGLFGDGADAPADCAAGTDSCNGGHGGLFWGNGGNGANGGHGGNAGFLFGNGGNGGDGVDGYPAPDGVNPLPRNDLSAPGGLSGQLVINTNPAQGPAIGGDGGPGQDGGEYIFMQTLPVYLSTGGAGGRGGSASIIYFLEDSTDPARGGHGGSGGVGSPGAPGGVRHPVAEQVVLAQHVDALGDEAVLDGEHGDCRDGDVAHLHCVVATLRPKLECSVDQALAMFELFGSELRRFGRLLDLGVRRSSGRSDVRCWWGGTRHLPTIERVLRSCPAQRLAVLAERQAAVHAGSASDLQGAA